MFSIYHYGLFIGSVSFPSYPVYFYMLVLYKFAHIFVEIWLVLVVIDLHVFNFVVTVDAVVINNGIFSWGTTDADVEILKKYVFAFFTS